MRRTYTGFKWISAGKAQCLRVFSFPWFQKIALLSPGVTNALLKGVQVMSLSTISYDEDMLCVLSLEFPHLAIVLAFFLCTVCFIPVTSEKNQ